MDLVRDSNAQRLRLTWQNQELWVEEGRGISLGKTDADLTLDTDDLTSDASNRHVSRAHATIEHKDSRFVLRDHSTNGTFVQTEDEKVRWVHRQAVNLWGSGWLTMGRPLNDQQVIRYEHV